MSWIARGSILAATIAGMVCLGGTARADYEWEYSVDGGAFTVLTLSDANNNAASVSLLGGTLTIAINTNSNFPGTPGDANLFNATTDVVNTSGSTHTVVVNVTETGFTAPTDPVNLTAFVGPVTIRQQAVGGATANASFGAQAFLDNSNADFGTEFATAAYSANGSQAGAGSISLADGVEPSSFNPITPSTPFSLTDGTTITLGVNTSAHLELSADAAAVPEPATLGLAFAGLGVLALVGRLRRRVSA